jgi:hypothetical protein
MDTQTHLPEIVSQPDLNDIPVASEEQIVEDASKIREFLRKTLLDSYKDEYKELAEVWRGLETKAQGNIAIAGIFIAGVFVFLREINPHTLWVEKLILGIAVILFVISVFFSIFVLQVRQVPLPPMGSFADHMFVDLLRFNDDELRQRIGFFINDQAKAWKEVKQGILTTNETKAANLWLGQQFLLFAIAAIAVLIVFRISSQFF